MFSTVLVANRGEIAVRVIRTLRAMGIRSVAVHSDADADARHVADADVALRLGPPAAGPDRGYLDIEMVLAAAAASGAEAVHPGYGFLSENAAFASACAAQGLTFIGPPAAAIATMGDKISARRTVSAAGVPVVPGRDASGEGAALSDADLVAAAMDIGLPVIVKPSAGGGGQGMRVVHRAGDLADEIAGARREARSRFGDDSLFVERYLPRARHIEVQVAGDLYGNVISIGERECSLQRRQQKVIEEAPSPLLTPAVRAAMEAQAVAAARACDYSSVGTVEFIVPAEEPADFFFMEMNTRLQVEHPVTEMVFGIDLVELQVRIAAGESLPWAQDELRPTGHAIEARVYAEDPDRGFLPTGGTVHVLREPGGQGVRIDSGLRVGTEVGSQYDPLLAKVVAHGSDRGEALQRLDAALASTGVLGVVTNIAFLRGLLHDDDVRSGALDTGLVERRLADGGAPGHPMSDEAIVVAALLTMAEGDGRGPWEQTTGWRLGGHAWIPLALTADGRGVVDVRLRWSGEGWQVAVDGGPPVRAQATRRDAEVQLRYGDRTSGHLVHRAGVTTWVGAGGSAWAIAEVDPWRAAAQAAHGLLGPVRSPMPGTVILVAVAPDQKVSAGDRLVVVEAMKMEHTLVAPVDGVVAGVHVAPGEQVALDQPLVTLGASSEDGDDGDDERDGAKR